MNWENKVVHITIKDVPVQPKMAPRIFNFPLIISIDDVPMIQSLWESVRAISPSVIFSCWIIRVQNLLEALAKLTYIQPSVIESQASEQDRNIGVAKLCLFRQNSFWNSRGSQF
jgi:hypothetical protein